MKKIVLLGDTAVGKTSLIRRFVDGEFSPKYRATLGTTFSTKTVQLEDAEVRLSIWDLAGQPLFKGLLREYARGAEAAIIVCDATRVATLWSLNSWLEFLKQNIPDIPITLLVNKIDLTDRRGEWDEHLERIQQGWDSAYYYTSAKTGEGVEEAFLSLSKKMVDSVTD